MNSHLLPMIKSIWVIRVVFRFAFHRNCLVSLREVKVAVDGVDIKSQLTGV